MIKLYISLIFSFFLIFGIWAEASSCCGGGVSSPTLITSDDKAQISTSITNTQIDTDVNADGVWKRRGTTETTQVLKFDMAHIFLERYQYGISIKKNDYAFGDTNLLLGYEFLPEWSYHPLKPKGLTYVSLLAPTGKSIYDSSDKSQILGRGLWAMGLGVTLVKNMLRFDWLLNAEASKSFDRDFNSEQLSGTVKPGYSAQLTLGLGYNKNNYRLGLNLTPSYEDAIRISGPTSSDGSIKRFTTASLSLSYLFKESWSGSLVASDQSLFGDPLNTSLNRSLALLVQKRWSR